MYLKSDTYREDLKNAKDSTVHFEALSHKRILITGATGLIGSFMADLLLYANREEHAEIELYLLARDGKRLKERFSSSLQDKGLHFIVQDIVAPLCLTGSVDYIIHAAGDGYPSAFWEHPVETMTPALFGTYQILQYAKEYGVDRFLYVSSGEVYGIADNRHAFTEADSGYVDSMRVRSCYPMAKRCAETLCVSFGQEYQVPAVVARPGHTYGACVSVHDNRATVQFLNDAAAGNRVVLHSAGGQMRSYTYVPDCVSGILTVLINGAAGEAYNIANVSSQASIADFARILAARAGVECMMREPGEAEQKELTPIGYAVLDAGKLERLGWKGQYDMERGIGAMLAVRLGNKAPRSGRSGAEDVQGKGGTSDGTTACG